MFLGIIILLLAEISAELSKSAIFFGIFSAPGHFEKRHSLRRTWLQDKEALFIYRFIVGNSLCHIDPSERVTPYDCEKRRHYTEVNESIPSAESSGVRVASTECSEGFAFKATYDIRVTHLGQPKCLRSGSTGPVRITLKGVEGNRLASATFYSDSSSVKAIQPVFFPRHSEGILQVESTSNTKNHCCLRHKHHNAATIITASVKKSTLVPRDDSDLYPGIMFYDIIEPPSRDKGESWEQQVLATNQGLKQEALVHGDILFVNVTDVYRNLPYKLLKFFDKALSFKFDFLVKTDDDTFIDLRRMMLTMGDFKQNPSQMWWWSTFKEYWHVSRAGKWREGNYKSVTYPPFPCGAGYVLSRGMVENLATQATNLQAFQGEDVSLGIWLAGVQKATPDGKPCSDCQVSYRAVMTSQCERGCEWTCSREDTSNVPKCNKVELSVSEMYATWEQYKISRIL